MTLNNKQTSKQQVSKAPKQSDKECEDLATLTYPFAHCSHLNTLTLSKSTVHSVHLQAIA